MKRVPALFYVRRDDLLGIVRSYLKFSRSLRIDPRRFLNYAARKNGAATRDLIRSMEERMAKHFSELLDRMDKRADERHREVIQAISALKVM